MYVNKHFFHSQLDGSQVKKDDDGPMNHIDEKLKALKGVENNNFIEN